MEYAPMIRTDNDVTNKLHINYHTANIGQGFDPHMHEEPDHHHTITCTAGSLKLTVDGVETTITTESGTFTFPQGTLHSVEALADGTEFTTTHPWGDRYIHEELTDGTQTTN
jgi:quercetin dioxygenase-like cupin family protein